MAKKSGSNGNLALATVNEQSKFVANVVSRLNKDFSDAILSINETIISRAQLTAKGLDPRRNLNDECGYPATNRISAGDYKELYERDAISRRVVDVIPDHCWKINPWVYETEDIDTDTPFEQGLAALSRKLPLVDHDLEEDEGFFVDENGSYLWEYLARADRLSGIGQFGGILIGVAGKNTTGDLEKPVSLKAKQERELTYLRTFDQSQLEIEKFETDKSSIRFGKPLYYSIGFGDPTVYSQSGSLHPGEVKQTKVHWTRIVHLADGLGCSEVFGTPRMRPVYNRLYDLQKLYGGSAEMYWKGAFPGLSLETHPELGGDIELPSDIKAQIENYQNGLQRILAIAGTTVKSIAPQVVDPAAHIESQLDAICILLNIPKRIFMGTERGKLASTQDKGGWEERLKARRNFYLTPRVIVPFINRLILMGCLPSPSKGYRVNWEDKDILDPSERASVAQQRAMAMATYIEKKIYLVMPLFEYLVHELAYSRQVARAIIDAHEDPQSDKDLKKLLDAQQKQMDMEAQSKIPIPQDGGQDRRRTTPGSGQSVT